MAVKKKASQLGLEDLRYDVEVRGRELGDPEAATRWVGTLLLVGGHSDRPDGSRVHIALACGSYPVRLTIEADSEVTVERTDRRPAVNFGSA